MNCLQEKKLSYEEIEMILVGSHAPFTWGKTAEKAVYNSKVLESLAHMAYVTEQVKPMAPRLKDALIKNILKESMDRIVIMAVRWVNGE